MAFEPALYKTWRRGLIFPITRGRGPIYIHTRLQSWQLRTSKRLRIRPCIPLPNRGIYLHALSPQASKPCVFEVSGVSSFFTGLRLSQRRAAIGVYDLRFILGTPRSNALYLVDSFPNTH